MTIISTRCRDFGLAAGLSLLAALTAPGSLLAQVGTTQAPIVPLGIHEGTPLTPKEQKAENKVWKRKLKETDPFTFKEIVEERERLQKELKTTQEEFARATVRIQAAEEASARLKANLEAATAPAPNTEDASKQAYQERHQDVSKGVVYKVQIGSFRNKDLSKYLDKLPNFSGDMDADGSRKYTLGYFGDYWEADTFKRYLREMGVKDAWIVSYKDGQRVPLKEVLEGTAGLN